MVGSSVRTMLTSARGAPSDHRTARAASRNRFVRSWRGCEFRIEIGIYARCVIEVARRFVDPEALRGKSRRRLWNIVVDSAMEHSAQNASEGGFDATDVAE